MHIMKKQVLLIILLALPLWLKAADVSVTGLRTEQMVDPMGLDTAAPRMSWRLESSQRNVMQTAYRILVASSPELLAQDKGDLWDSGKVESDASVWIPYQGKRLKSNQRVYWKVRSYTNRGETEWSEPARWGMGPLGEIHWKGRWIGWDAAFAWDREDSHSRLCITLSPNIREWFGSGKTPVNRLGIVIRSADGNKKGIESDSFVEVTDTKYEGFVPGEIKTAAVPAGMVEGINVVDNSTVTLVLYDKDGNGNHKDFAHVVGDFNNWTLGNDEKSQMYRDDASGCWWITLAGLDAGKEYAFQYYVGTKAGEVVRLADAYTEKILDPDNDKYIPASTYNESMAYPEGGVGIVSTFKIQKVSYNWKVNDFKIANPEQLVIYELHLRDFTAYHW